MAYFLFVSKCYEQIFIIISLTFIIGNPMSVEIVPFHRIEAITQTFSLAQDADELFEMVSDYLASKNQSALADPASKTITVRTKVSVYKVIVSTPAPGVKHTVKRSTDGGATYTDGTATTWGMAKILATDFKYNGCTWVQEGVLLDMFDFIGG